MWITAAAPIFDAPSPFRGHCEGRFSAASRQLLALDPGSPSTPLRCVAGLRESAVERPSANSIRCFPGRMQRKRNATPGPSATVCREAAQSIIRVSQWSLQRATASTYFGAAHLPPPAREASGGEGRLGRSPSEVGGASPRRFLDDRARLSMAALAQPPHRPRRLLASPSHPHPYPSPPLGFAERGEGGARRKKVRAEPSPRKRVSPAIDPE